MNDTGYRSPDEPSDARLDRLEASVRAGRVERVTSMLKFGLNTLFLLAGVSGVICAAAYWNAGSASRAAERAEIATAATEEARSHCAEACEAHGLAIENVRTDGARAVSCACADEEQRVVLWNDQQTLEQAEHGRCAAACSGVGAAVSRAIVECTHRNTDKTGDPCTQFSAIACSCNSPAGHRVLWDDRP